MRQTVFAACSMVLFATVSALHADYQLTVNVIGNGTVDPNGGTYSGGRPPLVTTVALQAIPDSGHILKSWSGTDDDSSTELTNTVVMDSNETVTVTFVPAMIVTRPAGGDLWSAGSVHNVEWSSGRGGGAHLLFSENSGLYWHMIAANIPDNGSHRWQIPEGLDSENCTLMAIPSTVDPNIVIIGSEHFTIQPYYPGTEVGAIWETLGGDFERTGLSDGQGPQFGCVKWQFETDGAAATGAVVGLSGRTHIGCEGGKLYTLDAGGNLLWTFDANSPLVGSPTIAPDGTVYIGGLDGNLYAVDIDGNLRWTHSTDGSVFSSPAVAPDGGKLYVGSHDGRLHALGRDGSELWTFATKGIGTGQPGSIHTSPTIGADGSIYVGGLYDPNLYALDPNDGSIEWACCFGGPFDADDPNTAIVGGWPFASPVVTPDGTIYQTLVYDPNLYAVDSNDGSILWKANLSVFCDYYEDYYAANGTPPPQQQIDAYCGHLFQYEFESEEERAELYEQYGNASGWSEPALGPDGTIYVSFDDPFLRAVEPNGAIKWVRQFGEAGGFTLTVGSDGLIYAAGEDGAVHVVDPNGREVAHFESEGWLNFPVIPSEYLLIVSDGKDDSLMMEDPANYVWAISLDNCRDISFDGSIDFNDIALLAGDWLACTDSNPPCDYQGAAKYLAADVDKDRYVRLADVALIAERWHGTEKVLRPIPPPPPPPLPDPATDPDPPDGTIDIRPLYLTWTAGENTTSYNVHFGPHNPPPFVAGQTSTEFYYSGQLGASTTYYWRIDAVNPAGTTIGEVWSFTTPEGTVR